MRVHIVQRGDTLWKIAKQYAIGFDELKRLNAHLANPDYIVPGMEIYLPEGVQKKEKEMMQQTVVKEQVKPVKEAPVPAPVAPPQPPAQPRPMWQGDLYVQPAPQQQPMPFPNWQQTHVHFQPTFEHSMVAPMPQPMPAPQMMPQQPIIIQQPAPQQQPIFIEQPIMQQPMMPPPMMQQPMMQPPQCFPQMMQPMPICPYCHGFSMEEPPRTLPIRQEESPTSQRGDCQDRDHQVRHYYEEMQHMMQMQNPCCSPQMMPYPMQMSPHMMPQMNPQMNPQIMPQMNQMPHPPKSCH